MSKYTDKLAEINSFDAEHDLLNSKDGVLTQIPVLDIGCPICKQNFKLPVDRFLKDYRRERDQQQIDANKVLRGLLTECEDLRTQNINLYSQKGDAYQESRRCKFFRDKFFEAKRKCEKLESNEAVRLLFNAPTEKKNYKFVHENFCWAWTKEEGYLHEWYGDYSDDDTYVLKFDTFQEIKEHIEQFFN